MSLGTVLAAVLAVLVGVFCCSSIPTRLGFYRWLGSGNPRLIGTLPAYHYGIPWNYTLEELYQDKNNNLSGQTAIVTGANSGIGYQISLALVRLGAHVTMACRTLSKCEEAAERIRRDELAKGLVKTMVLDTSSLSSVKAFADAYIKENSEQALAMLFLNAGTVHSDFSQKRVPLSEDGIEKVFAANYLGHHLLYRLVELMLLKAKLARVVQTSSAASFGTYTYRVATNLETLNNGSEPCFDPYSPRINRSYSQSKLAQIIWVKELAKRLGPDSTIHVNAFHPGVVNTEFWDKGMDDAKASAMSRKLINWLRSHVMWAPAEGALTGLFLGVAVDRLVNEKIRGKYFHPQVQEVTHPLAENEKLQVDLWNFSEELIQKFLPTETSTPQEEVPLRTESLSVE